MSTKNAEIEAFIHQLKPDIIQATETCFKTKQENIVSFPESCNIYHKNR